MIKVLFICHGNICRSPMAEFVMKDLVEKAGMADQFVIASAATSTEEIYRGVGNPVYPPARKMLNSVGIACDGHHATRIERSDYEKYDLLIGMEDYNIRNMMRILGSDPKRKVCRLLDYTGRPRDIADPWYTDDFDTTYEEILEGCEALLSHLKTSGKISYS